MSFVCRICSREFDELPAGKELKRKFGIVLIQLEDKTVHEFRVMPKAKRSTERKPNMIVLPKPVEPTIPVAVEVPVHHVQPKPLNPEPKTQEESQSFGGMAAAFKFQKSQEGE